MLEQNASGVDSHDPRVKLGRLVLVVALLLAMERPEFGSAQPPANVVTSGSSQAESAPTVLQEADDQKPLVWTSEDPAQDKKWEFKDSAGWKFVDSGGERVLSQFLKSSDYQPPHRSPLHIALLKDHKFESFQMDAWVKSTHAEYGHRDVCLFFGYAAPDKFYYVHMASEMDDRANQIFLVNQADRVKISVTTTTGTRWEDRWHQVRLTRDAKTGEVAVFFDDMNQPVMTAVDKTIGPGQIGFGSFDDTVDFKRLEIRVR
ncbi:MAG: hypothetical protein Q8M16_23375 [Pirellulaceae bacterium]|nr:hypothetical protein [Pirellulaceae bacterium]